MRPSISFHKGILNTGQIPGKYNFSTNAEISSGIENEAFIVRKWQIMADEQ